VNLGIWQTPRREIWGDALAQAVNGTDGRVILIGRGLACYLIAWFATAGSPDLVSKIVGALLVAPPDLLHMESDIAASFGPVLDTLLPFPSIIVASRNDVRMRYEGAQFIAQVWGSDCIDGGEIGSAGAIADLGSWDHGKELLKVLADEGLSDAVDLCGLDDETECPAAGLAVSADGTRPCAK
jgi:predicted alpha/beta hydrolase family esterase